MGLHPEAQEKLDRKGVDWVCDRIEDGDSLTAIARTLDIGVSTFTRWIGADAERSARIASARRASALSMAHKAEAVLLDLDDDGSPAAIARARELASHYRWEAKMRNPRDFGEKVQTEHSGTVTWASLLDKANNGQTDV